MAKLESNSFAAAKIQDHREKLTSWQYCRISSFAPKQLLVPEVSGSHFPVWIFTCIFSFPQNMAIWGSATANPVPALAASACEDKRKQNTSIALSDGKQNNSENQKPPGIFSESSRLIRISSGGLQTYFVTMLLKAGEPTPSFHQQGVCFSRLCFYYCNNSLPKQKTRVIHSSRLRPQRLKQMSEKLQPIFEDKELILITFGRTLLWGYTQGIHCYY